MPEMRVRIGGDNSPYIKNVVEDFVYQGRTLQASIENHPSMAYGLAYMMLADLCEVHGIDDMDTVIRALQEDDEFNCGESIYHEDSPETSMISVAHVNGSLGLIRSVSTNTKIGIQFADWLIANVFPRIRGKLGFHNRYEQGRWLIEKNNRLGDTENDYIVPFPQS